MATLQFKRGTTFIDPQIAEPFLDTGLNVLKLGISGSDFITLLDSGSLSSNLTPLEDRLDNIELTTSSLNTSVSNLNSFTQSFNTAISLNSSNVTILGNLDVQGTTTTIDSTTITLGDNVIELNGTGDINGGILVNDVTNPNTISGSLLWDGTNDYWKAGQLGSENEIITTANIVSNLPSGTISGSSQITITESQISDLSHTDITSLNSYTASNDTTNSNQNASLNNLNSYTASNDTTNTTQNQRLSALESFTGSIDDGYVTEAELAAATGALETADSLLQSRANNLESFTSSIDTTIKTKLDSDGVISGSSQVDVTQTTNYSSINQYTDSDFDTRFGTKSTTDLSEGTNQYYTDTKVKTKLNTEGVISGSSQVDVTQTTNYSSINQYTDSDTQTYIDSIGLISGSVSGQLPSGTVSGSEQIDHDLTLNFSPAEHFTQGNITTVGTVTTGNVDAILPTGTISGSSQITITESQISDLSHTDISSLNSYTSSNDTTNATQNQRLTSIESFTGSIDNDFVTEAELASATGALETADSLLQSRTSNLESFTSSIDTTIKTKLDSDGVISGSSQIDHDLTTNFVANEHIDHSSITIGSGEGLSGGGTIDTNRSITLDTGSSHFTDGVVQSLPTGTVSGSSQVDVTQTTNYSSINQYTDSDTQAYIDSIGLVSGSVSGQLPSGTVSGSSQIDVTQTINYSSINQYTDSDTQGYIDDVGVLSGSSQVNMGGDISGDASNATVEKVQGVSLTSGEATQLANIGTNTISNTQWGYLGVMNQNVRTTDNVTFNTGSFTGDVTINGNFTVLGSATEISTTELTVEDKLITIASGSADSAAANGAGIYIDGANESITWNHSNSRFNISDDLNVEGNVTATGDVVAFSSSDRRLKNNLTKIVTPLTKLSQINGYSFDWNTDKQHIYMGKDYGVVAQEIQEVLPELVQERENGYLAVNYEKLVPLLIESIKELKTQVEHLNKKLEK